MGPSWLWQPSRPCYLHTLTSFTDFHGQTQTSRGISGSLPPSRLSRPSPPPPPRRLAPRRPPSSLPIPTTTPFSQPAKCRPAVESLNETRPGRRENTCAPRRAGLWVKGFPEERRAREEEAARPSRVARGAGAGGAGRSPIRETGNAVAPWKGGHLVPRGAPRRADPPVGFESIACSMLLTDAGRGGGTVSGV